MFMLDIPSVWSDVLLLLIRLVVATAFIVSARNKFKDMRGFATKDGVPLGLAYFIATAELLGGLGMLFGVLAPLAGAGLALLMIGTMSMHIFKWRSPYWASKGGWEYDLMLACFSAIILLFGAGAFSLEQYIVPLFS